MESLFQIIVSSLFLILLAPGYLSSNSIFQRNCQDIKEEGNLQSGHYVVYETTINNTEYASMVYCGVADGMQSVNENDGIVAKSSSRNCADLQDEGMVEDGVNIIYPFADQPDTPHLVLCVQTREGGGWTVINHRDDTLDDRVDFNKTYEEYTAGFGDVNYDFYIGNDVIHSLTDLSPNELWIDIEDMGGFTGYAHYKYFHVGPKDDLVIPPYMLDSGFYEGTIGEGLEFHNGMSFSTYDQDNDISTDNCAANLGGGWWYRNCMRSNLNGLYETGPFCWESSSGPYYQLSKAQMMVRPASY